MLEMHSIPKVEEAICSSTAAAFCSARYWYVLRASIPEGNGFVPSCPGAGRDSTPWCRPTGNIPRPLACAHPPSPAPAWPLCLPGTPNPHPGPLPDRRAPAYLLFLLGAGCMHQCPRTHPTGTHFHSPSMSASPGPLPT